MHLVTNPTAKDREGKANDGVGGYDNRSLGIGQWAMGKIRIFERFG